MKQLTWMLLMTWLFFACQDEQKCKYKPAPIFEAGLPHVVQYKFETEGQQSLESVYLDTDMLLEIYQNVCVETAQEYKFTVKGDFSQFADSMWLKESVRQLVFLSTLSPKQSALKAWADMIEQRRPEMHIGESREVQEGIFVKVDRILSKESSVLLLTFEQKGQ